MIILLKKSYDKDQKKEFLSYLDEQSMDYERLNADAYEAYHISKSVDSNIKDTIETFTIVEDIITLQRKPEIKPSQPNNLYGFSFKNEPLMIGGPCSIESEDQLKRVAGPLKEIGVKFLRGGAFKPRTSPYTFQGLEEDGLKLLQKVAKQFDMYSVSEIVKISDLPLFEKYIDVIQIGSRNMHNYALLKAVAKSQKPVILKRGFASTIEEWLMSAKYLQKGGNNNIILCERGIRTFEPSTRFTLDLNGMLKIKQLSGFPVIVDPSHASGDYEMVEALSKASIAAGTDGLMIEVHSEPSKAKSDGMQSLKPSKYQRLYKKVMKLYKIDNTE